MNGVNKVFLLGTVGKDPEVRFLDNNKRVASFSLATNKTWRDKSGNKQEQTEWHNVEAWDYLADLANNYIRKGTNLWVEGEIRTESWEDKNGGGKKYKTKISADSMQLIPGGTKVENPNGGNGQQSQGNVPPPPAGNYAPPPPNYPPPAPPAGNYAPPPPNYPPPAPPAGNYAPPPPNYPPPPSPAGNYAPPPPNYPPPAPPAGNYAPPPPLVQNPNASRGPLDTAQQNANTYVSGQDFRRGLEGAVPPDDLPF